MGILREKSIFQKCAEVVLRVMRKNQNNILSYLESFKHDPLIEQHNRITENVDDALKVVERKLMGIVNDGSSSMTAEEQVEQLILEAINEDSLRKMYIGWMPWL